MNTINCNKERNPEIELLRFIFAVIVFLSHMNALPNGALAVDFFFLLTGYLTMASIRRTMEKHQHSNSYIFIFHKIKSFYPELLAATFISIAIALYAQGITLSTLSGSLKTLINGFIPFLKMTGIGISVTDFNGVTWYLSSMLIGLLILHPFLVRYSTHPLLLIAGVFTCCFLCIFEGTLTNVYDYAFITYEGNLRAIGELLIGASIYPLIHYLTKVKLTLFCSIIVTLLKVGGICVIIFITTLHNSSIHGVALCAATIVIILVFSNQGIDKRLYNNKLCLSLGALSLPLYLSHRTITHFPTKIVPSSVDSQWGIIGICFIYSILAALFVLWIGKVIRKNKDKIHRFFFID